MRLHIGTRLPRAEGSCWRCCFLPQLQNSTVDIRFFTAFTTRTGAQLGRHAPSALSFQDATRADGRIPGGLRLATGQQWNTVHSQLRCAYMRFFQASNGSASGLRRCPTARGASDSTPARTQPTASAHNKAESLSSDSVAVEGGSTPPRGRWRLQRPLSSRGCRQGSPQRSPGRLQRSERRRCEVGGT